MLGSVALIVIKIIAVLVAMWFVMAVLISLHALISAILDIKTRPQTPMLYCPSGHGFYKEEHALGLPGTTAKMCPQCFMNSMRKVPH